MSKTRRPGRARRWRQAHLLHLGTPILTLLVLSGCGSVNRAFVHPQADMSFYQRIGVKTFRNLSADRFAGEKVTAAFVTELLMTKKVEVAEPGQFNATLLEVTNAGAELGNLDLTQAQIKQVGEKAGVQGIIEGTVTEYEMTRIGTEEFPLISISARLVDVQTGKVVWMASASSKGGPKLPLIGIGETHTLGELTVKICSGVVRKFVREAF